MKLHFKIAISLGAILAIVVLLVALAFVPSVQRWALMRALSSEPGTEAEIGRVSAGMSAAEIRDVTLRQDGAVIRLPAVRVEYSAWAYVSSGALRVGRVDAKEVLVDLRNFSPKTPATPASKSFEGVLGAILLPAGLKLDSADIDAEVILPSPGNPEGRRLRLAVKGGGVEAGGDAIFDYVVRFNDPETGALVSKANLTGRLAFKTAADGSLESLTVGADLRAEGEQIPKNERIVLAAEARRDAKTQEVISLTLSRQDAAGAESSLLNVAALFNQAAGTLEGTWKTTVDNERLASVLPAQTTPDFALGGEGRFSLNTSTGASEASGEVNGTVAQLERAMTELGEVGPLEFSAVFATAADAKRIRVQSLRANIATAGGKKLLRVESLQAVSFDVATATVSFDDPATDLATIAMDGVPVAWIAPFVSGVRLSGGDVSGGFLVQSTPAGDRVRIRPSQPFVMRGFTVADEKKTLLDQATLTASAELAYSGERIDAVVESWSLATAGGDRIEGKARATVEGESDLDVNFDLSFAGTLPTLLKQFSPVDVGTVGIDGEVSGQLVGGSLTLQRAKLDVRNATGANVLSGRIDQALKLDMATATASVSKPESPAVSLALGMLPLGWVEPFVSGSKLGGSVEGGAVELFLMRDGHAVTTKSPVSFKGVSVAMDGAALLDRVDGTWEGSAAMTGDKINSSVRKLELRQGRTALLSLSGEFAIAGFADLKTATGSARGSLEANIGELLAQPAAADFRVLEAGRMNAVFDVKSDSAIVAKVQLDAKGLVAREGRKALGDMTVSVDGKLAADNSGEFQVPIRIDNAGRKSDLLLAGSLTRRGEVMVLNSRASGSQVFVEDFQMFAGLVAAGGTAPASASPAVAAPKNTTRDEKPIWEGVEGSFDMDIKKLIQNKDYPLTNLVARAVITSDRVSLEKFEGRSAGNPVTASGALKFERTAPRPYVVDGKFKVPGFDAAALFTGTDPRNPPMLETVVVADGTFSGRGLNIEDLAARVQGRVDLKGGKGVYRGLARSSDMVSTGAGLVGALFGGQRVQDATQAVSELAAELRELKFEEMTLKAFRGDDLKLNIEALELTSPTLRLSGKGLINMDPEIPLVRQSQRLELRLGFKGTFGERMVARRMTDGSIDELGYARFRVPIMLTGNLMSPDSKQFWDAVTRSMVEMGIQSFLPGG